MKKAIFVMAALALLGGCSNPQPPAAQEAVVATPQPSAMSEFNALEQSALDGDYQAQRNLAYTLSTGVPNNPILACAWRMVILTSGDPQVDESDVGNKSFDCERKLDEDGISAAIAQSAQIQRTIEARKADMAANQQPKQ